MWIVQYFASVFQLNFCRQINSKKSSNRVYIFIYLDHFFFLDAINILNKTYFEKSVLVKILLLHFYEAI